MVKIFFSRKVKSFVKVENSPKRKRKNKIMTSIREIMTIEEIAKVKNKEG